MSTSAWDAAEPHDPAQDLRAAMEQEAIDAALAGRRGDDELDRHGTSEPLEGPDAREGLLEGDASDDPVYGGDDVTGTEPLGDLALEVAEDEGLTEVEMDASEGLDEVRVVDVDDTDRA